MAGARMTGVRTNKGRLFMVAVAAGVFAICLAASFFTRGAMANRSSGKGQAGEGSGLVDQGPWQTVSALAPLAASKEEQSFARDAERLADHEGDRAFGMALRQAGEQKPVPR